MVDFKGQTIAAIRFAPEATKAQMIEAQRIADSFDWTAKKPVDVIQEQLEILKEKELRDWTDGDVKMAVYLLVKRM